MPKALAADKRNSAYGAKQCVHLKLQSGTYFVNKNIILNFDQYDFLNTIRLTFSLGSIRQDLSCFTSVDINIQYIILVKRP